MKRVLLTVLIAFLACIGTVSAQQPERLPNIVIIFIDDMGYADCGVFGAKGYETPHIDQLAREGRRFTDFYVAQPVCSASRAALLTGCYPNRIGIHGALGPNAKHGINSEETTLAEICKQRGYATACFGKWHLGHHEPFLPPQHGFDEYLGLPYSNDMWPFHPDYADLPPDAVQRKQGYPDLPLIENNTIVDPIITGEDQARLTTLYTERAVDFIDRHADEPFFLYVPHTMVHVPLFVSDQFAGKSEQGLYGDVMMEIDWSVGQIVATLERNGLTDDTLVMFTSDNGPWLSYGNHGGSAEPLREGTTWDGGVRVPCIMKWPGRIPAGSVCQEPGMTIDMLPTIAHLIGAKLPDRKIDGLNIWPLIAGQPGATNPHEAYFFYYHQSHLEAVRSGRWKLQLPHNYRSLTGEPGRDGRPNGYSQQRTELALYDLHEDIGEQHDVSAEQPEVVARLLKLAEKMRADIGDALTNTTGSGAREPGRVADN